MRFPHSRARSLGVAPAAGALLGAALLGAALLSAAALLASCSKAPQDEVWIIGLDGADWDVLDPLIAKSALPNLAKLRSEGVWGRLRSDEPMLSPILWTSIATGRTADLHGVTWFMTDAPDGTKIPISSRSRLVRALWNMASEKGVSVGVLGWWATWPVEPVNGFIVSDYVAWHSFGVTGQELDVAGKTWPPELINDVKKAFVTPDKADEALLARMIHLPKERLGFDAAAGPFGGPVQHLRQALVTAEGYTDLGVKLVGKERPRFFAIYYEGTDATQHLFMEDAPPKLDWVSDADFAAYKDVVAEYWKWQDALLGRLLAKRKPTTTVIVVSDHGFRTGGERLKEKEFSIETADQSHMPDGIILIDGPQAKRGQRIDGASIYDVAPTVLHLLGLPVAQDLHGKVLTAAIDDAYMTKHPVTTIATYETGPWDRGPDVAIDPKAGQRMEEMLRSLGYIAGGTAGQSGLRGPGGMAGSGASGAPGGPGGPGGTVAANGGTAAAGSTAAGSTPNGSSPSVGTVEQTVNLSVVLRKQGRYDEAAHKLEDVLKAYPGHVEARANLARTYAAMGRLPDAETIYRGLLKDEPRELYHYEDLALALAHQNRNADAGKVFEDGLRLDPQWARGLAGRGFAFLHQGQPARALAIVDSALTIDPQLATAHYYRGLILQSLGRSADALTSLGRAHQIDPRDIDTILALSSLQVAAGDAPQSEQLLRDAIDLAGEDGQLLGALGALMLQTNRLAQALPLLQRAATARPDDIMVQGNYGMAAAFSRDLPTAAQAFEHVIQLDPSSHEGRAQLAVFYAQMGKLDRAATLTQEAMRLQPQSGRYVYQLAMIYDEQGKKPEAQQLYQKARQLDPSLPPPGQAPQGSPSGPPDRPGGKPH